MPLQVHVRLIALLGASAACADQRSVTPLPPAVATVEVVPDSASVPVGGITELVAVLKDADGNTLPSRPVNWSSSAPSVAITYGAGFVTGESEGVTTVVGEIGGLRDTARIAVTPAPAMAWPNEPPGFTTISDQPWDLLTSLNWVIQFGSATIGVDLTAPLSPPSVLQIIYPIGFTGGSAPGTLWRSFPGTKRLFVGTWWKPSNPWQGHSSNVNKIQFLFPASGGDIVMVMYGPPGGPYELRVIPQFPGLPSEWLVPNVRNVPVALRQWHRLEWLIDYSTGRGTVQWWVDGLLFGDHRDVPFPSGGMTEYKISPTWGGLGDTKTQVDYFYYDHVHLSWK